jgi:predicted CXXCH cytochrome family protein
MSTPHFPMRLVRGGLLAAVLLLPGLTFAQGIRNSVHDLSMSGTGGKWASQDTNQICIFCHAPHHALSTQYLWNRNLPDGAAFSFYTSVSMDATAVAPKSPSLRCLSCHDGSVAIDAFNAGRTWTPRMLKLGDIYYPGSPYFNGGGANIGGNYGGNTVNDLTDDHPVSFVYDSTVAAADGMLQTPANVESAGLPLFGPNPAAKTLECSTCHEVHRKYTNKWLLRVDVENASQLCRTCHLK